MEDNQVLNFTTEYWKPIKGLENLYEVSTLGRVRNNRGKILKTYKINSGYLALKLTKKDHSRVHPLIHRLVLETFNPIDNQDKITVNHVNHNKTDNRLKNLEWLTYKDNLHDAMEAGLCKDFYIGRHTLGIKHKSKVSKYYNVGYDKSRNKWVAAVRNKGKNYEQKRFDTEEEAALHVNYILDKYNFNDRPRNVVNKS